MRFPSAASSGCFLLNVRGARLFYFLEKVAFVNRFVVQTVSDVCLKCYCMSERGAEKSMFDDSQGNLHKIMIIFYRYVIRGKDVFVFVFNKTK